LLERVHGPLRDGPEFRADEAVLAACRANLRQHLALIGHLAYHRRWLGGDRFSLADVAAAAQISCLDYLGEVPWAEHSAAKEWYQRLKSRPSVRALLTERLPGLPPPMWYTDADF
jgi:glutathione S-transferase